jgi:hypothetical protein
VSASCVSGGVVTNSALGLPALRPSSWA